MVVCLEKLSVLRFCQVGMIATTFPSSNHPGDMLTDPGLLVTLEAEQ